MVSVVPAGYERTTERQLYLLELKDSGEIAAVGDLPKPHFACFIAWDARLASTDAVSALIKRLLDAGAAYISAWGPDCARVHDIADESRRFGMESGDQTASVVMTTWHEHESLEDALWFFLFNTFPDDSFART